jgi:hypothetical protein
MESIPNFFSFEESFPPLVISGSAGRWEVIPGGVLSPPFHRP